MGRRGASGAPCNDVAMSSAVPTEHLDEIAREELIRALRERTISLVDVLSAESFAANHIPGAINLPVADVPTRALSVFPDRRAPIVTYCGGPT
jgi:rhodanese-related sulfurtransferase